MYVDQAADNVPASIPCLMLFKTPLFAAFIVFKSFNNIFFNSLSKRVSNWLIDGFFMVFIG